MMGVKVLAWLLVKVNSNVNIFDTLFVADVRVVQMNTV